MKVTVCQIDPRQDYLDDYIRALTDHVAAEKSDFLLLPEMSFSPWLAADKEIDEQLWLKAVTDHTQQINQLGKLGVDAILGTRPIVNPQGSRRNLAYLWTQKSGKATAVHEKYYLPDEEGYWEASWYDRGSKEFQTTTVGDLVLGVQICTEMWFFEWSRHYAAAGVDLLCVPRATPHGSTKKWLAGGQAAAVCSGAYCLSSNLWCPVGEKVNCGGLSWIIDPEGNVLATTDVDNPMASATIDLQFCKNSKLTYPRYVLE